MLKRNEILDLVTEQGTPLMIVDHQVIRDNYDRFCSELPRVKPFYAIKANPEPEIIRTLYKCGANFDIASLEELNIVEESILGSVKEKNAFLEEQVIYANPIKRRNTLPRLEHKHITMTFDNFAELDKIQQYCEDAVLILRVDVPNEGAVVELSTKFGAPYEECLPLIERAASLGFTVKGLSFHVGSQCTNASNYEKALALCHKIVQEAAQKGHILKLIDIGGGFPAPYISGQLSFSEIAVVINQSLQKYFPDPSVEIIAEPGRFLVANAAISVVEIQGKSVRKGVPFYYVNDGVYQTFSGTIFDHIQYHFQTFREGPTRPSAVVGPTCDALDKIVMDDPLPAMEIGDLLYSVNTGAYTNASATYFNGFAPAKVIHINTAFSSPE